MNIIFDFGNVLVRWEPEKIFLPCLNNDKEEYNYFWDHICDADFRNRIDAGEKQEKVIAEYQAKFPKYASCIAMYWRRWEETLPGEVPGMYELVKQLKADPANRLYGLTNWSMETYPTARKRFEILQLIDDYVVSGAEHIIKPDHRLFQILLDRYGLKAEECIFVDDREINVASACEMGFKGVVFSNVDQLRERLDQYKKAGL